MPPVLCIFIHSAVRAVMVLIVAVCCRSLVSSPMISGGKHTKLRWTLLLYERIHKHPFFLMTIRQLVSWNCARVGLYNLYWGGFFCCFPDSWAGKTVSWNCHCGTRATLYKKKPRQLFTATSQPLFSRLVLLTVDDETWLSDKLSPWTFSAVLHFPMCNVDLKKKNVNLYSFKCFRTDVRCI